VVIGVGGDLLIMLIVIPLQTWLKVVNQRLANKVIWDIEDMSAAANTAVMLLDKAITRAELKCADPALLIKLSKIRNEVTDIRILAAAARDGEYAGKRGVVYVDDADEE